VHDDCLSGIVKNLLKTILFCLFYFILLPEVLCSSKKFKNHHYRALLNLINHGS
jgi:hypothetical protein